MEDNHKKYTKKKSIYNALKSQITSPKAYHMLGSASTKASVSNQMSFRWKIKVPRVQVFLRGVAAKQDKGLPARAVICYMAWDHAMAEITSEGLPRLRFWKFQNEGNFSVKISKKVGPLVFKNH